MRTSLQQQSAYTSQMSSREARAAGEGSSVMGWPWFSGVAGGRVGSSPETTIENRRSEAGDMAGRRQERRSCQVDDVPHHLRTLTSRR